ncbi:type IV pilin protein [Xanthomonas citri]|uniref:type IV pilin protein n=1 Tax=Xanthomonas citri TaxID=346 RepID=UPI0001CEC401|nr:type IV pilin protein [Xanthomonas citri]EFF45549.1 type IV pilin PilE [Xanthomonas citri pv. aurantifolii str. ICPB 11122]
MKRAAAHVRGFTLIELMIVVAVVAILSAIAYPSYTEHVRKSRRAQAKVDLVEYGQLAERFHTVQNTYSGFTLPTNVSPREGGTAAYTLALTQQTQSGYVITATPAAAQAADKCGTLSIDQG